MKQKVEDLSLKDFSKLVGSNVVDLPKETKEEFKKYDFRYRELTTEERDQAILKMIKKLTAPNLSISGPSYKKGWQKGWGENLKNFKENNYDLRSLIPKYIKSYQPIRLYGDFVMPISPDFELHFYNLFRGYIFRRYLKKVENVYEFGCGTGFNLIEVARIFPQKKLFGSDWVKESVKIIELIRDKNGINIDGFIFDFFNPDKSLKIRPNSAILLIGALEQTGDKYLSFLKFLVKHKDILVIHIDSMNELYDKNNLIDYLALWHDRSRNYLQNYLKTIQVLEKKKKLKIKKIQKVACGGFLHDGYSYDIWGT